MPSKKIDLRLTEEQIAWISKQDGSISEVVRNCISTFMKNCETTVSQLSHNCLAEKG